MSNIILITFDPDIPGEHASQNGDWNNKIECTGMSLGAMQKGSPQASAGLAGGTAEFHDISIQKMADQASPVLIERCCEGRYVNKGVIRCLRQGEAGGQLVEWLTITMDKVMISNYQVSGHDGDGGLPHESLSLNFRKVKIKHSGIKDGSRSGSAEMGWDQEQAAII